jgi:uncharacterized MAPEG superfamily protein
MSQIDSSVVSALESTGVHNFNTYSSIIFGSLYLVAAITAYMSGEENKNTAAVLLVLALLCGVAYVVSYLTHDSPSNVKYIAYIPAFFYVGTIMLIGIVFLGAAGGGHYRF